MYQKIQGHSISMLRANSPGVTDLEITQAQKLVLGLLRVRSESVKDWQVGLNEISIKRTFPCDSPNILLLLSLLPVFAGFI